MTLHTINKSGDCLARALGLVSKGDTILLLEDGVYAVMDLPQNTAMWESLPEAVSCYALSDDLAARGISDKMLPFFTAADWQDFVSLTVENDKIISWG